MDIKDKEIIPSDFSGMLYPPSAENGVYLLLGLLLPYLHVQFAFEKFEINPKHEEYEHSKYIDAKAKMFTGDSWKDVSVEFKLYSSGILRDADKYPGLYVDYLICWEHDALGIEKYAGEVIDLKLIYNSVAPLERNKIILNPESSKNFAQHKTIDELLSYFSEEHQEKVLILLEGWPYQIKGGTAEILFRRDNKTVFRACSYSTQHLILIKSVMADLMPLFASEFNCKEAQNTVKIFLDDLSDEDVKSFLFKIK
jgi:hypothetical protein